MTRAERREMEVLLLVLRETDDVQPGSGLGILRDAAQRRMDQVLHPQQVADRSEWLEQALAIARQAEGVLSRAGWRDDGPDPEACLLAAARRFLREHGERS